MKQYYQDTHTTLYQGHVLDVLRAMPDNSVDMCMTSPPYWGLRAYKTEPQIWGGDKDCLHEWGGDLPEHHKGQVEQTKWKTAEAAGVGQTAKSGKFCLKCNAWQGELGLEPKFEMYIDHLIEIFAEVKRVTKYTIWVNIGDSYAGGKGSSSGYYREGRDDDRETLQHNAHYTGRQGYTRPLDGKIGIPAKSLIGIPERFALAMTDRLNLIRRNTIIWWKRNPMPESVKDRFTDDFEYLYMFAKNGKYFFEQQFESCNYPFEGKWTQADNKGYQNDTTMATRKIHEFINNAERNKRCMWDIPTEPYSGAHFAVFPEKLVETPILAGCPIQICTKCGKPRVRIYEKTGHINKREPAHVPYGSPTKVDSTGWDYTERPTDKYTDCGCGAQFEAGIILDPFVGSGTTLAVAKRLGRKSIGVELNPKYCELAVNRIQNIPIPLNVSIDNGSTKISADRFSQESMELGL